MIWNPFRRKRNTLPSIHTDFSRMESFAAKRNAWMKYQETLDGLRNINRVAEESNLIRRRNHFGEDIERALGSD